MVNREVTFEKREHFTTRVKGMSGPIGLTGPILPRSTLLAGVGRPC